MRLEVSCQDRMGLAKDILSVLEGYGINLMSIDASNCGFLYFQFATVPFEILSELLPQIRKIESVSDVRTVTSTPSEQEHYALATLLKTLPDPVFSIDLKGKVCIVNESALNVLNLPEELVQGEQLVQWVHGGNFNRWLGEKKPSAQSICVTVGDNEYLAEILPIYLPDEPKEQLLTGAVVVLKSPARLGKQFNAFQNPRTGFEHVLAQSSAMKQVIEQAHSMAQLEAPLLITGETGVGKGLLAESCHAASMRREHPFITLNCATLSAQFDEAEFFGRVDAENKPLPGIIDEAKGGTIFLTEVGELSADLQVKLLQLLQTNKFRRVGSEVDESADIRIICSTHKNLAHLCQNGHFREDLYYRLHVLSFHIPSLKERKEDIVPLAEMFIDRYSEQIGSPLQRISGNCREYLLSYAWPGNVRQLKNAIYRAISMNQDQLELTVEQLKLPAYAEGFGYFDDQFEGTLEQAMKQFEANLLRCLYPAYPSTRQLARKLGVSHTAIANKLREYDINKANLLAKMQ